MFYIYNMKMKYIKTINELHHDTYYSAFEKDSENMNYKRAIKFLNMTGYEIDPATLSYLETALWADNPVERFIEIDDPEDYDPSLTEEDIERIENLEFTVKDFTSETIKQASDDLKNFREMCGNLLNGVDDSTIGNCFYLSRKRHSSGFFVEDGLSKEQQQKLHEYAEEFSYHDIVHMVNDFKNVEIS